jgi:hypothetical protein
MKDLAQQLLSALKKKPRVEVAAPKNVAYDSKYDAFYDKNTGEWTEGVCKDKNCAFCKNRPSRHHSSTSKTNHQTKPKRGARPSNQRTNVRGTNKTRLQEKK